MYGGRGKRVKLFTLLFVFFRVETDWDGDTLNISSRWTTVSEYSSDR